MGFTVQNNLTQRDAFESSWNRTKYSYDYRNRLIEVQDPNSDTIATYAFDALGRRISKEIGTTKTYFFYDTGSRVIAEYEDGTTPTLKKEFVYGNGIDEVLAMFKHPELTTDPDDWDAFVDFCETWLLSSGDTGYDDSLDYVNDNTIDLQDFAHWASVWDIYPQTETRYYYLRDALGSVRGLVGGRYNDPNDYEFYNFDVYGKLSIVDGEESKSGNPFLFAGYRYDAETGLYHTPFRAYDPETGRWLQFDPIGNADSMSLYEYCISNPTMYVDPWGLVSKAEFRESIGQARQAYKKVQQALQRLGVMAQNGNSSDSQLYAQVDEIERLYNQYRSQRNVTTDTANEFYGGQWWVSGKDGRLMSIALSLDSEDQTGGAIKTNPDILAEQMRICCNLCDSTEKVANRTTVMLRTAQVAETTCTIAGAAGGVTLIGKEAAKLGLKKGAAYIAKQAAMMAAGQVVATAVISKAEEMGFTETQIRMGTAAFQALAMHKAFRGKQGCATNSTKGPKTTSPPKSKSLGRSGKQTRLKQLADDPSVSSADRGWIRQDVNQIQRGTRKNVRVPPGKNLAHRRGFEAKKGYSYEHSDLQDIDLHKLQHKHEGY